MVRPSESVINDQPTPHNVPEERRHEPHCSGSLKFHICWMGLMECDLDSINVRFVLGLNHKMCKRFGSG
jgi:hypothetical protein